jgi:hypothetical protein
MRFADGNGMGEGAGYIYLGVSAVQDNDGNSQKTTDVIIANAQYIIAG